MVKENTTDAKEEPAVASTAVLACPFCGSKETSLYGGSSDLCWIECQKCYASGPVSDRHGAELSWNTRIAANTGRQVRRAEKQENS